MNEITLYLTALLKELENMNGVMAVTVTDSLGSAPREPVPECWSAGTDGSQVRSAARLNMKPRTKRHVYS